MISREKHPGSFDIVHKPGWGPPILKDVKAYSAIGVDIGVKHFRDKSYSGRFVWVLLGELDCQLKRPILKRGVMWSKDNCIPEHDVVVTGGSTYTCRGILLETLEIPHQSPTGGCRHPHFCSLSLVEVNQAIKA